MRSHRGLFSALGLGAVMAGLIGSQAHADVITLNVDLNGVAIADFASLAPNQSVTASLVVANTALTAHGSAYQFTALSASSNFSGADTGQLVTMFTLNTSGDGTTAAVLSIDVVQQGFLSPVGPGGTAVGTAMGTSTNENGSLSYTGDFQGANLPTLVFPVSGSNSYGATTGDVPIGSIPSGYQISDHFLISLDRTTDNNSLSGTGTTTVSAPVPEPASVGLMLAGTAVAGLALPRLRRKAGA